MEDKDKAIAKLEELVALGRPLYISLFSPALSGQNLKGILTGYEWDGSTLTLQTSDCAKGGGGIRLSGVASFEVGTAFTAKGSAGQSLVISTTPQ